MSAKANGSYLNLTGLVLTCRYDSAGVLLYVVFSNVRDAPASATSKDRKSCGSNIGAFVVMLQ